MSLNKPRTNPCVGKCSHNVGDDICRGCKRTIEEVCDWNRYSVDKKIQIMQELKVRDPATFIIPVRIFD